jgi:hypothetical protein
MKKGQHKPFEKQYFHPVNNQDDMMLSLKLSNNKRLARNISKKKKK